MKNQAGLAMVAREGVDANVRLDAIHMMSDQTAIAWVAVTDKEKPVRETAVDKLRWVSRWSERGLDVIDQTLLAQLAEIPNRDLSIAASRKLTDQPLLAQLAARTTDKYVRILATQKLPEEILAKLDAAQPDSFGQDFERARSSMTVESLSGFLKRHPDSIRVGTALVDLWHLLVATFPDDHFSCNTNLEKLNVDLPEAIAANLAFVAVFRPKRVLQPWEFSVEFLELAGQPAQIDSVTETWCVTYGLPEHRTCYWPNSYPLAISLSPYRRNTYRTSFSALPHSTDDNFQVKVGELSLEFDTPNILPSLGTSSYVQLIE